NCAILNSATTRAPRLRSGAGARCLPGGSALTRRARSDAFRLSFFQRPFHNCLHLLQTSTRVMKLNGTYLLNAPREKVFAAITDPAILQRVIDGCEKMVQTGEDSYDAHLKIGLAGLKGSYVGKVQLKDKQPPDSYRLLIEGKGAPGFVKGTARI